MFDLYETTPLWNYPELPPGRLTVPRKNPIEWTPVGPMPVTPEGEIADSFSEDVDVSGGGSMLPRDLGIAQQAGERKTGKKTKWGSLILDMLPRMGTAALAGMATPNVAGGGPTDIARAAMGGQAELERRDNRRMAMEDRRRQIAQQEALRRAQEDIYGAHADLYRRQAEVAGQPKATQRVLPPGAVVIGPDGKVIASNPQATPNPNKGRAQVSPETGKQLGLVPNEKGEYWAPEGAVRMPPAPKPDPAQQAAAKLNAEAEARESLADKLGLKGQERHVYIATGRIPQPKTGSGEASARWQQGKLMDLERWKAEEDMKLATRRTSLIEKAQKEMQSSLSGWKPGAQLPPEVAKRIDDEINDNAVTIDRLYRTNKAMLGGMMSPGGLTVRPSGPPQGRPKTGAGATPRPATGYGIALGQ